MRRKDKEITDKKEMEEIIRKSKVCHIAFVDDDKPYVVPVNFGYSNDCVFIHTAKQGKKLDLIKKNNNVCLSFDIDHQLVKKDIPSECTMNYKSVIAYGKAQMISDNNEVIKALNHLMNQYYEDVPPDMEYEYTDHCLNRVGMIKIEIESMTGKKAVNQ